MKKKLLAVFLFSATTMLCAQTLQTSNKYFEVGNFKEVHNPAWGVTDDPWCINDHTFIYDKKKKKWHVIGITHARKMDYIKAFIIGGLICVLVQILMDNTKLLPGRIMVLLVCTGAVLGAIGVYEPFLEFAGCGASVPLSGFGYNLWKGIKEAVDQDGFIGLFRGGFKMAAVGTSAALIFSYIASLIFKPKMTK